MKNLLCWCIGAGCIVALAGCNRPGGDTVNAIHTEAPVKSAALVEAMRPERRDISAYLTETGHITAENQVEVLAKGTGHCLAVLVEEGDRVTEGQVLAELDKDEIEAQVRQSRVNVTQQKTTYDRAEWGFKEGIVPEADRDNSKSAYEQARATLEMQEVQLSFFSIRAPIAGVVTKRAIQQGTLVSSGMPTFSIVDPSSYILPINVTERSLPRLRIGQEAVVTIDSSGDREFRAHVRRINPGVDPQTGSVKVILDFDPADHQYLRESAFARYSLVMETHEGALVVPKDAIVEENAQRYVMVVKPVEALAAAPVDEASSGESPEGNEQATPALPTDPKLPDTGWVAARIAVETGLEDSNYTEILSGIDGEALVITLGQQTVNEGDTVEVGNLEETLESRGALSADELLEKARQEREKTDIAVRGGAQNT